jgi:hypothetical protein
MRNRWGRLLAVAATLAACLASGCASSAPGRSRGEAEAVLVSFYDALIRKDWPAAHAVLHTATRATCSLDEFTPRARAYRQRLGFEPRQVLVRFCEEQEDIALAHVVLVGRQDGKERSFRDAITLRHDGTSWGIVLPTRFGRPH